MSRSVPATIAVVTPYYYPDFVSSVPLVGAEVARFAAAGHTVVVLTSAPAVDAPAPPLPRGVRVLRCPSPVRRRGGTAGKLLEYVFFTAWVFWKLGAGPRFAVALVTSTPPLIGWPVVIAARFRRFRVVYHLQDLFPLSATVTGHLKPRGVAARFLELLERKLYSAVAGVIAITPSFATHVTRVAPTATVVTVPNFADTDVIAPIPHEANRLRRAMNLPARFLVVYAGRVGFLQDFDMLLDAAQMLAHIPDIAFVVIGEGGQRPVVEANAQRRNLRNVHFYDFAAYDALGEVYSAGDAGLILLKKGADVCTMPSKLYSIMASGRPVIAVTDEHTDLALVTRTSGAGLVVPPHDGKQLAAAVERLFREPELRASLGSNGRRHAVTYGRDYATTAIMRFLEAVAADGGRGSRSA